MPLKAKYLVRFDDLCPTMNWAIWNQIESALLEYKVCPILAVVPENLDDKLQVDPPDPEFWDRVRLWQSRGWSIALHGFQHKYVTSDSGIMGLNKRSEFAGLSKKEQKEKLTSALEVFQKEAVKPDLWVAPAHAFDETTVEVLSELGIKTISDGLTWWPFRGSFDTVWIPQQIWRFRFRPFGLWTVCFHHNEWNQEDIVKFRTQLQNFNSSLISVDSVLKQNISRRHGDLEKAVAKLMLLALKVKGMLKRCLTK